MQSDLEDIFDSKSQQGWNHHYSACMQQTKQSYPDIEKLLLKDQHT